MPCAPSPPAVVLRLALAAAASAAASGAPAQGIPVPAELQAPFARGEAAEVVLLFEADAADDHVAARKRARAGRAEDDDAELALRAALYRGLKDDVRRHAQARGERLRDYTHLPMASVRVPDLAALQALLALPGVRAAYANRSYRKTLAQSLPLIAQPQTAGIGRTGNGATVAVLDTGVDYTRSEFGACSAPGVPAGCKVAAALDFAPDDGLRDADGHGSNVAAIALGVAPGARIAALDVFDGQQAFLADFIDAINWTIANRSLYNIVAINLSVGDGVAHATACSGDPFATPLANARAAGILSAVSAGNEGFTSGLSSPACVPAAVSVGAVYDANLGGIAWSACSDAVTAADKVTCFSNSAPQLALLAPGALITAGGATYGGTSQSAPHAAGAFAVLRAQFPAESPDQTVARLTTTGAAVTDARNGLVKPRIDLIAAQGAPANDAYAARITLAGNAGRTTGYTYNAGKQAGEPNHAGNAGGRSTWWRWVAPGNGTLALDTHGSGFDTLLAAYTGTALAALAGAGASDDDGSAGGTSGTSFAVTAGTAYSIAVDGRNGAAGNVTLNWNFQPAAANADLALALAGSGPSAASGLPYTWAATVTNLGPGSASQVLLNAPLPADAALVSASAACSAAAGTLACQAASLASGASLSFQWTVQPAAAGTLSQSVTVSAQSPDPQTANNAASAAVPVVGGAAGGGGDADVPLLPPWAFATFAAALAGIVARRVRSDEA